ncbi:hypothetical protein WA158_003250 [Blastocystis sp. Blastoise]
MKTPSGKWVCTTCTYENQMRTKKCLMCGTKKPIESTTNNTETKGEKNEEVSNPSQEKMSKIQKAPKTSKAVESSATKKSNNKSSQSNDSSFTQEQLEITTEESLMNDSKFFDSDSEDLDVFKLLKNKSKVNQNNTSETPKKINLFKSPRSSSSSSSSKKAISSSNESKTTVNKDINNDNELENSSESSPRKTIQSKDSSIQKNSESTEKELKKNTPKKHTFKSVTKSSSSSSSSSDNSNSNKKVKKTVHSDTPDNNAKNNKNNKNKNTKSPVIKKQNSKKTSISPVNSLKKTKELNKDINKSNKSPKKQQSLDIDSEEETLSQLLSRIPQPKEVKKNIPKKKIINKSKKQTQAIKEKKPRSHSTVKKYICISMLTDDEKNLCFNIQKHIGSCIINVNDRIDWSIVDMVILGKEARSIKSLMALALGIPVVMPEYIYACIEQNDIIDETPYIYPCYNTIIQKRNENNCGIFSAYGSFYCMPDTQPPTKDLDTIIRAADGSIASSKKNAEFLVCGQESRVTINFDSLDENQHLIPESYILDCIASYELMDISKYLLIRPNIDELSQEF